MVYIKDFVRVVEKCVSSPLEGGMYNVGNGWQVSLEEQIKGIIEVFSPKDNPSKIIYCPEKSDPLENAFDVSKTFSELDYKLNSAILTNSVILRKKWRRNLWLNCGV